MDSGENLYQFQEVFSEHTVSFPKVRKKGLFLVLSGPPPHLYHYLAASTQLRLHT